MFYPAGQFQADSDLSIVHPVKTTADGDFISHSVSHRFKGGRFRRDLQPSGLEEQVYYKVIYKGQPLTFNLTVNSHLVSRDYILERRNGSSNGTKHPLSDGNSCHLLGTVATSDVRGTAAISTCRGLVRNRVVTSDETKRSACSSIANSCLDHHRGSYLFEKCSAFDRTYPIEEASVWS